MALLTPNEDLTKIQDKNDWTSLMAIQEELKTLPFGDVWEEYCKVCGVPCGIEWLDEVKKYEKEVLAKRG
jgi:L-rhamnose isomerase